MSFIADLFTGGAYSRNKAAKEQEEVTRRNVERNYNFQYGSPYGDELGGEVGRQYEFAVKENEKAQRNVEAELTFREETRKQEYDFGMGIRAWEHQQRLRAYDLSVSRALQQVTYNEIAENAALVDQDRLIHEQFLTLAFDETETLFNYAAAAAGVGLKQRQAKASAVTEAQATRISALKATGAAGARGMAGRSAGKTVQGILAETGARQAAIIDQLMFNTEAGDQELFKMSQQLLFDKAGFETSRESARMSDTAARTKLRMQRLQADIQAENTIALKPEISPPLPLPIALPRPEFEEIFKPKKPPLTEIPAAAQENLFAAGVGTIGGFASKFVTSGLAGRGLGTGKFKGFHWGNAFGGLFS